MARTKKLSKKGYKERKALLAPKAYQMRIAGMPYRRIADALGVDHVTIFNWVKEQLQELQAECRELIEQYRDMELERLDQAQAAIYSEVLQGNLQAIKTYLQISERRSKLLGLDAPQKQDITVKTPEPIKFVLEEDGNKSN